MSWILLMILIAVLVGPATIGAIFAGWIGGLVGGGLSLVLLGLMAIWMAFTSPVQSGLSGLISCLIGLCLWCVALGAVVS